VNAARSPSSLTAIRKDLALLNVLLVALGSSGDVFPYIGLGRALRARGHRVTLLANSHFEPVIRSSQLDYVELGTEADYRSITENPSLWNPISGARLIVEGLVLRNMRRTFEIVEQRKVPGQTVIAAPFTAFGARLAHERLGIPLVTVCLQPSALRSVRQPAVIWPLPLSPRMPGAWNQLWFGLSDRAFFDPLVRRPTNELRAEIGLNPVRGSFTDWSLSAARVLGLFPEWFAPEAADWPASVRLCQFPLYDTSDLTPTSLPASAFLDAEPPALVFTPGSANRHASAFFGAAVEACRIMGARGVLVSSFQDHLPTDLPPFVQVLDSVPFSQLFNRAAAVVHHGGIGTSAHALAAATPQLIMPMAFDQHDNAARLERLGVARSLSPRRFRGAAVARLLGELLGSPSVAASCRLLGDRIRGVAPLEDACCWVERAVPGGE
jgi:rhamnosyltransferase subunit B